MEGIMGKVPLTADRFMPQTCYRTMEVEPAVNCSEKEQNRPQKLMLLVWAAQSAAFGTGAQETRV